MYKLIASDMDNTLLDSNHKLSIKNRDAIIAAQKKGIHFVPASGRPTSAMVSYAEEMKLEEYEGYLISYNGAMITNYKTKEVIFSEGLTKENLEYLLNKAIEFDTSLITYMDNRIYALRNNEYVKIEQDYTDFEIVEASIEDLDINKIMKCMMIDEPNKIKNILNELKKTDENNFFLAISDPHFVEIANINVNKGKALKILTEKLNLLPENVIACGDAYNDLEMLEFAGVSVAAGNAVDRVKEISDYISKDNNNNLMEDVIKKYILTV